MPSAPARRVISWGTPYVMRPIAIVGRIARPVRQRIAPSVALRRRVTRSIRQRIAPIRTGRRRVTRPVRQPVAPWVTRLLGRRTRPIRQPRIPVVAQIHGPRTRAVRRPRAPIRTRLIGRWTRPIRQPRTPVLTQIRRRRRTRSARQPRTPVLTRRRGWRTRLSRRHRHAALTRGGSRARGTRLSRRYGRSTRAGGSRGSGIRWCGTGTDRRRLRLRSCRGRRRDRDTRAGRWWLTRLARRAGWWRWCLGRQVREEGDDTHAPITVLFHGCDTIDPKIGLLENRSVRCRDLLIQHHGTFDGIVRVLRVFPEDDQRIGDHRGVRGLPLVPPHTRAAFGGVVRCRQLRSQIFRRSLVGVARGGVLRRIPREHGFDGTLDRVPRFVRNCVDICSCPG